MYIETHETPNPSSLKFVLDRAILGTDENGRPIPGIDFPNAETADHSPLAQNLFALDGVIGVFLGTDVVTVTKADEIEWPHLKPLVLGTISDYVATGAPAILPADDTHNSHDKPATSLDEYEGEDREVVEQIIDLIDTRVRPAVAADGGDIVFKHYEPRTGVVFLSLHGSCQGCPSSTYTLKAGIENMLKHYVPEVVKVEPVI